MRSRKRENYAVCLLFKQSDAELFLPNIYFVSYFGRSVGSNIAATEVCRSIGVAHVRACFLLQEQTKSIDSTAFRFGIIKAHDSSVELFICSEFRGCIATSGR